MRRVLLSTIVLTLSASPSLASVCTSLQADFEAAKSAREQANAEFEVARLAHEQAQVEAEIARIKRNELRRAFQTVRFDRKASSSQRVQARADWQQAVGDSRATLNDLRLATDTLDMARGLRDQDNVDFELAKLAYEQAQNCHPLYWVKLATTKAVDGVTTVAGVATAVAFLAAYPLWMAWPFLVF